VNIANFAPPPASPALAVPAFGWVPYTTPMEGYLNGAANLTTANAQYQVTIQQARLLREQSRQAALETHRRTLEARQYELDMRPTPEQIRAREQQQAIERSLNNPPSVEIWSGQALNVLLSSIQQGLARGLRGARVPLPQDALPYINVTTGATSGNVGIFRQGGRLEWPLVLRGAAFKEQRTRLDQLTAQAVSRAALGAVDDSIVTDLNDTLQQLSDKVNSMVADLTPTQFVQATRYLRELRSAFRSLQDPNVARYFSPAWTPRGATVGELVQQMTTQGLRFAPSITGGEPAYTAVHQALVTYTVSMNQVAAQGPGP
jgi:hypothetical protein